MVLVLATRHTSFISLYLILSPSISLLFYCHHQRPTTLLRYAEPVVRTLADKPHDAAGGFGENELTALAEE